MDEVHQTGSRASSLVPLAPVKGMRGFLRWGLRGRSLTHRKLGLLADELLTEHGPALTLTSGRLTLWSVVSLALNSLLSGNNVIIILQV